jgi:phage shock protein PspC (stress-responsive transcriptional regulator)
MKKTISVNISGMMFNVDEDAFLRLSEYLTSIKKHFEGTEGQAEIIADIESRIAELMQSRISETRQVISIDDIEEIIAALGQPFEMDEDQDAGGRHASSEYSYNTRKRFFRDGENRKIAGVAAGIAAYFSTDPTWIRVLFVLLVFASGFGLVIYAVLWLVVPEARTTAEKLEMKGEPVNVDNIERTISEEFEKLEKHLNEIAGEAKEGFHRAGREVKRASSSAKEPFYNLVYLLVRAFSIVFGIVFLTVGILLIMLFGSLFLGWDNGVFTGLVDLPFIPTEQLLQLMVAGPLSQSIAPLALGGFIAIPLILLVYSGLRMLIGSAFNIPGLSNVAGGLWIASAIALGYIIAVFALDFRETQFKRISSNDVSVSTSEVLYLKLDQDKEMDQATIQFFDQYFIISQTEPEIVYMWPNVSFAPSDTGLPYAEVKMSAKAGNIVKASERLEAIDYQLVSDSNTIKLAPHFSFPVANSYRSQAVNLTVYLPIGQQVEFDDKLSDFFRKHPGQFYRHIKYAGNRFTMTRKGLEPAQL